jgi:hypothetical protein
VKELAARALWRYGWLAGILAVAVVAATGVHEVLADRASTPAKTARPGACQTPLADRGGIRGPVSPPGGGGLRVVEKGFGAMRGGWAALGAIVENTSDLVAYRVQVDFHALDEHHRSAVDQALSPKPRAVVRVILPGKRIGVGSSVRLRRGPGFMPQWTAKVTKLEVKMSTAEWWPLDGAARATFRPVVGRYRQTKYVPPDGADYMYSVDSPLCGTVARDGMSIIFRDHGGAVAGGLFFPNSSSHMTCAPGKRSEDIFAGGVVRGVDDQKTEVYPYCDLVGSRS